MIVLTGKDTKVPIQSAARVMHLLEVLIEKDGLGIMDLSRELGLTKSTTSRLASTLKQLGYIVQDSKSSIYYPTLKIFSLGRKVVDSIGIRSWALPVMKKLALDSGETVSLGFWDDYQVIYVEKIDSTHLLKSSTRVGTKTYAHSTAIGKAILAFLPEEERAEAVAKWGLPAFTPKTITEMAALAKELAKVRAAGYAVDEQESYQEVCAVGAPIFDGGKNVTAGISIVGPAVRVNANNLDKLGRLAIEAAGEISKYLGYVTEYPFKG